MDVTDFIWLSQPSVANTLILIAIVILARFLIVRMIKGKGETLSDSRRRWISVVQNSSILLGVLGLIYIWSPQLSTFALSLTAFAVALVIATKEYLLCVVGALYRATASPFTVGDWIEVHGLRGEVLSEGIVSTRLQELGVNAGQFKYTGRVLSVPNSVFLTQTVHNESYRKRYLHHQFTVTVDPGIDPAPVLDAVRPQLPALCEDTDKTAERYWSMVRQRLRTELPPRDPSISVETSELGKIVFVITIFCPTDKATKVEADITEHILTLASELQAVLHRGT